MLAARTLAGVSMLVYALSTSAAGVLPVLQEQDMQEQALIQQVGAEWEAWGKIGRGARALACLLPCMAVMCREVRLEDKTKTCRELWWRRSERWLGGRWRRDGAA